MQKKRFKKLVVMAMAVMMFGSVLTVHAEDGVYTVKRGDNLSKIAKEVYGSREEWKTIYEANKGIIKNANILYAGQQLVLPGKSTGTVMETTTDTSAETTTDTATETTTDTAAANTSGARLVKAVWYWNNAMGVRADYAYDSQGNKIKETRYDMGGQLYDYTDYSYDGKGNLIKEVWYYSGTSDVTEYTYDSQGNELTCAYYNDGGALRASLTQYSYDGQGNKIKGTNYDSSGAVRGWTDYSYDGRGNQIKAEEHDADGTLSSWSEYSYDGQGNMIKKVLHIEGFAPEWTEYGYDSQGNKIKESYYNADGTMSDWVEYTYE